MTDRFGRGRGECFCRALFSSLREARELLAGVGDDYNLLRLHSALANSMYKNGNHLTLAAAG